MEEDPVPPADAVDKSSAHHYAIEDYQLNNLTFQLDMFLKYADMFNMQIYYPSFNEEFSQFKNNYSTGTLELQVMCKEELKLDYALWKEDSNLYDYIKKGNEFKLVNGELSLNITKLMKTMDSNLQCYINPITSGPRWKDREKNRRQLHSLHTQLGVAVLLPNADHSMRVSLRRDIA